MKTRIAAITTLIFVGVATVWSQARINVPGGTKFDFGEINRGKVMEKKITIKNIGKDTLIISRVDVSCGCTGAMVSSDHIAPGKSGELQIKFDSKNFTGQIHKTVTVNSNDKDTPQAVVEFTGNVIEELAMDPQQFWFKDAETGRVSRVTLTIRNQGKATVSLTGYQTALEGLKLTLPPGPIEPGKSAQITAEFEPKAASPYLNDAVTVKTTSKNEPEVFIRIFGNVKEFKFQ